MPSTKRRGGGSAHQAQSARANTRAAAAKAVDALSTVTATIQQLQSHPQLNGFAVEVAAFDAKKGRYICEHMGRCRQEDAAAEGKGGKLLKTLNLRPANLLLPVGCPVLLTGVVGNPALNGQRGVIERFDPGKHGGQYRVRVEVETMPARGVAANRASMTVTEVVTLAPACCRVAATVPVDPTSGERCPYLVL